MTVCFHRFRCNDGHVFAVRYADVDNVCANHCAVCGNREVYPIEKQTIDADVIADSDVLVEYDDSRF